MRQISAEGKKSVGTYWLGLIWMHFNESEDRRRKSQVSALT